LRLLPKRMVSTSLGGGLNLPVFNGILAGA
jgi:hypothetical protein